MVYQLQQTEHTENERKRIHQLFTSKLKRKGFKKCMVGKGCCGSIVKGHFVSKSWLGAISTEDEVYVFSPFSPPGVGEDELAIPAKDHVNRALTRYFTCEGHEELFFPIDRFNPDLESLKNIHLVLYKAIVAQMWLEHWILDAYRTLAEESSGDELFRVSARVNAEHIQGLQFYKRETERCIDPERCRRCQGGPCRTIGHEKLYVRGEPSIALSQFSDGTRRRVRMHTEEVYVQPIANCGITVLPTRRGHTFLFHYFRQEKNMIQSELDHILALQSKKQEAYISAMVLSSCEDIAIRPSFWEGLGRRRRDAMRKRFRQDVPDTGVGTLEMMDKWADERLRTDTVLQVPNPNQINLFRRTKP